jgi:hypothetical protein
MMVMMTIIMIMIMIAVVIITAARASKSRELAKHPAGGSLPGPSAYANRGALKRGRREGERRHSMFARGGRWWLVDGGSATRITRAPHHAHGGGTWQ